MTKKITSAQPLPRAAAVESRRMQTQFAAGKRTAPAHGIVSRTETFKTETATRTEAHRKHSKLPRNHRKLARAIFAKRDAVTVGRELLESESATVKARVWETLVNYAFGEFAGPAGGAGASGGVQIVWDMPGPPHESE